jgi:glycosyltransferase involved in cell wall biosynthesis
VRIALVIGSLHVGGAETQVAGIARGLQALGHDVEVVLLTTGGPLLEPLQRDGIVTHLIGYPGVRFRDDRRRLRPWLAVMDGLRLLGLAALFRRRRYDVVHAFLFHSYVLALPLAWVARVPVRIAARRGLHDGLPKTLLLMPLTRMSTRLATAVVGNAQAVSDDAHTAERVPLAKLHVIPNAVDIPTKVADPGSTPPTGLIIANLIHYKGHLDLVEAMAAMSDPPVIRCIGDGPMRLRVEQAIAAAGLGDRLLLEGSRPDARELYLDVQFAVLASHSEGMPNAVLEAMAAGLPVVATAVGGCSELIHDGVTGYLVPPRDPGAMAAALLRVTTDADWRRSAGRAARRRAEQFSWAASAQAHECLYRDLLDDVRGAG